MKSKFLTILLLSALVVEIIPIVFFVHYSHFFRLAGPGKEYYQILGLTKRFEPQELKKAYKKKSLLYHPDKNPGNQTAEDMFLKVGRAYEVLKDKDLRRIYDSKGIKGLEEYEKQKEANKARQHHGFWGGMNPNAEPKGDDIHLPLYVSLEDIYNGRDIEIKKRGQTICDHCRGTGAKSDEHFHTCTTCDGSGHVIQQVQVMPGFVQRVQQECPKCGGTGQIISEHCPVCGGRKIIAGNNVVDVEIERGVPDGFKIVYSGEADEHPDVRAGDLIFTIHQLVHPKFFRNGDDLHYFMPISLKECFLGVDKHIRHLDDHLVHVQKSGVIKHGDRLIIKEDGMPVHQAASGIFLSSISERGSLFIHFEVEFPEKLTPQQEQIVKSIF